ncbi:hypothetical protein N7499_009152 [Penicillium canescens]|nr:hypothetical protein N7499_009152 [Penicillium canescens]KAJ6169821.1 hypothetical protein N7485_007167 [Penicillium canescens]
MPRRNISGKHVRKHVTTACIPCRETKVKCDGTTPVCINCQSKGKDCSYRKRDDKRKIPVRIAVSLLAKRVGSLSQYIRDCGFEVPAMNEQDEESLTNILQALGLGYEEIQSEAHASNHAGDTPSLLNYPARPPEQVNEDNGGNSNGRSAPDLISNPRRQGGASKGLRTFPTSLGFDTAAEALSVNSVPITHDSNISFFLDSTEEAAPQIRLSPDHPPSECEPHELQPDYAACDDLPDADADDEFTNQLSYRLGRLQFTQDGQLRYFGSTSNLTLLDALVSVDLPNSNITQKDTQEVLENAKLNIDVDKDLENHLLELYFTWQNPSLYLVDSERFWKARKEYIHNGLVSSYYSQSLVEAMCALGAAYAPKYHPELVTFPRSLPEFFGDRARVLLECEFEHPSLSTIQSLVLVSNHEASRTRDTRGWLYSGMAMRLAFDLGLHLDMTPYVEKGIISVEECNTRRTIFWAAYINELFWGYYLGRSVRSPMAGVTVQKPHWNNVRPPAIWKPYDCPKIRTESMYNPLEMICHRWVSLYDLMMPLTDVLYGCSEISKRALQELTAATVGQLFEWKKNLPENLDVNVAKECQEYLPHILILHMQYYQFVIHCHRPYISKHYIQPQPPQGPGSSHARKMCIESAITIAKVLMIYERLYGFRKANLQMVSFTFSAALILIFTTVPTQSRRPNEEHTKYLGTCFWALDEMGYCFENAKRTSMFLNTLQQQWHKRRRTATKRDFQRGSENCQIERNTLEFSAYDRPRSSMQTSGPVETCLPADYWNQDYTSASEEALDLVDFMDPDLCNVLLSEGIPRAFV